MARNVRRKLNPDVGANGSERTLIPTGQPVKRTVLPDQSTYLSLYSNDTQVQVSPWDVRLIFGEIRELPTEEKPELVVRPTGEVRMSPQHARRVVDILQETLTKYEATYGELPKLLPKPRASA